LDDLRPAAVLAPGVLGQTGVESGALPWACVLAAALALAAGAALLLRRAYRERGEFRR